MLTSASYRSEGEKGCENIEIDTKVIIDLSAQRRMCNTVSILGQEALSMEDIGGGMAAPSKSAVERIWFGLRPFK